MNAGFKLEIIEMDNQLEKTEQKLIDQSKEYYALIENKKLLETQLSKYKEIKMLNELSESRLLLIEETNYQKIDKFFLKKQKNYQR